ncbi:hypothetical protein [Coprobacter sp.]|uniref:hypothetical protein n=1 Tax=Coprobacter sp. TaxID=1941478 RepID=UPI003AB7A8F4
MTDYNNDELYSYKGLNRTEYIKEMRDRNSSIIMQKQYELTKQQLKHLEIQQQEMINERKYREESSKISKRSFIISIVGICIAFASLVVAIIALSN